MGMTLESVRQRQPVVGKVDVLHFAGKQLRFPQEFPGRVDDGGQIQIARGDLVQHWCEEEEVVPIDQSNLDIAIPGELVFQFHGAVNTAESAAKNVDLLRH
jgi:hypothetical protein